MSPVAFRPHSCRQLTFDEAWEFGPICQGIWRRESWFEDVVEGSSDEEEVNEGIVVIDWIEKTGGRELWQERSSQQLGATQYGDHSDVNIVSTRKSCSVPSCISDGNT